MSQALIAVVAGTLVGFLFSKVNLPVPAPPNLAGLMGIAGIMIGYWLGDKIQFF
ncbi:XapX domain-containing protein [Proteinivorax hydrogeniformans]|uniref:XapX domain-containing protein n=1 Tax=Proteinivorax hydrogeniformans TaxID=1826727 RepID=A0AAU8HSW8_9FIRM